MNKITAASIVFFTRDRKILLQERKNHNKWGEDWAFFGGTVEEGEHHDETIVRETKEELNHDLLWHTYLGSMTHRRHPELNAEIHFYIKEFDGDLSRFTLGEGSDMRLFTIDEALQLKMMPGDDDALKMLKEVL